MPTEYKDCQIQEVIDRFKDYIEKNNRPSVSGFAVGEFMARETLYDWAKRIDKETDGYKWPFLRELLAICKTKQRFALTEGGLNSTLNSRIVSLCLQTNHGHVQRNEQQENPDRPLRHGETKFDLSNITTEELMAARDFIIKARGGDDND